MVVTTVSMNGILSTGYALTMGISCDKLTRIHQKHMSLSEQQQALEFIKRYKKILLLISENPNGDSLGSALSLYLILKKIGKMPTLVCASERLDEVKQFKFLPAQEEITTEISSSKDFILSIANPKVKIECLRYENTSERLNIFVTPKNGELKKEDLSINCLPPKYELLIIIDCPDIEELGKIYEKNAQLFFETPIINIDHHSSNEHFGRINLVEPTASSCSEIIFNLISPLGENLFDQDSSTCLLTGIIDKTENFQNQNTSPRVFEIAAALVSYGARQQEIIRYLYKTRPLKILKLWGKVFANLEEVKEPKAIVSCLSQNDFKETSTSPQDLPLVVEELKKSYWQGDLILLFFEAPEGKIRGLIRTIKNYNPRILAELFENSRLEGKIIEFEALSQNFREAKEKVIEKIKRLS